MSDDASSQYSHRPTTTLEGVLRFSIENTVPDDDDDVSALSQPMEEERRQFLEEALKSMTIDVIQILQKQISILRQVDQTKPQHDITEFMEAMGIILEYIDHIDIANDFHKIGGFMVLYPALKCYHPSIRANACELIATLCQNNPYCQNIILDHDFLEYLLKMLEADPDLEVTIKALYAISCIVRENEDGYHQLLACGGLPIFLRVIKKHNEKQIIKICFLLASLCKFHPELKRLLVDLQYLPVLITLVSEVRKPSHEYVLALLVVTLEENIPAINECKLPKYNLLDTLTNYHNLVRNRSECMDEEQYVKRLLHLLYGL